MLTVYEETIDKRKFDSYDTFRTYFRQTHHENCRDCAAVSMDVFTHRLSGNEMSQRNFCSHKPGVYLNGGRWYCCFSARHLGQLFLLIECRTNEAPFGLTKLNEVRLARRDCVQQITEKLQGAFGVAQWSSLQTQITYVSINNKQSRVIGWIPWAHVQDWESSRDMLSIPVTAFQKACPTDEPVSNGTDSRKRRLHSTTGASHDDDDDDDEDELSAVDSDGDDDNNGAANGKNVRRAPAGNSQRLNLGLHDAGVKIKIEPSPMKRARSKDTPTPSTNPGDVQSWLNATHCYSNMWEYTTAAARLNRTQVYNVTRTRWRMLRETRLFRFNMADCRKNPLSRRSTLLHQVSCDCISLHMVMQWLRFRLLEAQHEPWRIATMTKAWVCDEGILANKRIGRESTASIRDFCTRVLRMPLGVRTQTDTILEFQEVPASAATSSSSSSPSPSPSSMDLTSDVVIERSRSVDSVVMEYHAPPCDIPEPGQDVKPKSALETVWQFVLFAARHALSASPGQNVPTAEEFANEDDTVATVCGRLGIGRKCRLFVAENLHQLVAWFRVASHVPPVAATAPIKIDPALHEDITLDGFESLWPGATSSSAAPAATSMALVVMPQPPQKQQHAPDLYVPQQSVRDLLTFLTQCVLWQTWQILNDRLDEVGEHTQDIELRPVARRTRYERALLKQYRAQQEWFRTLNDKTFLETRRLWRSWSVFRFVGQANKPTPKIVVPPPVLHQTEIKINARHNSTKGDDDDDGKKDKDAEMHPHLDCDDYPELAAWSDDEEEAEKKARASSTSGTHKIIKPWYGQEIEYTYGAASDRGRGAGGGDDQKKQQQQSTRRKIKIRTLADLLQTMTVHPGMNHNLRGHLGHPFTGVFMCHPRWFIPVCTLSMLHPARCNTLILSRSQKTIYAVDFECYDKNLWVDIIQPQANGESIALILHRIVQSFFVSSNLKMFIWSTCRVVHEKDRINGTNNIIDMNKSSYLITWCGPAELSRQWEEYDVKMPEYDEDKLDVHRKIDAERAELDKCRAQWKADLAALAATPGGGHDYKSRQDRRTSEAGGFGGNAFDDALTKQITGRDGTTSLASTQQRILQAQKQAVQKVFGEHILKTPVDKCIDAAPIGDDCGHRLPYNVKCKLAPLCALCQALGNKDRRQFLCQKCSQNRFILDTEGLGPHACYDGNTKIWEKECDFETFVRSGIVSQPDSAKLATVIDPVFQDMDDDGDGDDDGGDGDDAKGENGSGKSRKRKIAQRGVGVRASKKDKKGQYQWMIRAQNASPMTNKMCDALVRLLRRWLGPEAELCELRVAVVDSFVPQGNSNQADGYKRSKIKWFAGKMQRHSCRCIHDVMAGVTSPKMHGNRTFFYLTHSQLSINDYSLRCGHKDGARRPDVQLPWQKAFGNETKVKEIFRMLFVDA